MGIDARTVELMERFGIRGRGASFGYPHFVDRKLPKKERKQPSEWVFEKFGLTFPDVYDVGTLAGHEIRIMDLNKPLGDGGLVGAYDYVINPGTFEHVFNIGQAMVTSWEMLKPGGLGFHHGSVGRPRLGYWNMTLNTWEAWCAENGELRHFEHDGQTYYAVTRRGEGPGIWPQENNVR